jgi:cation:H+ antiporter
MLTTLLLAGGFVLLVYGANFLVDSASSIAVRYKVPNIVIGLTIVAFGTSAPELVVNVVAAMNRNTEIVLGNVLGSNIFNVLVILGITAIIYPLSVQKNTTWIEVPLNILAALIVLVIAADTILNREGIQSISRSEGIICLAFFLIFIVYNMSLVAGGNAIQEEVPVKIYPPVRSFLLLFLGFGMLVIGGRLIVTNAVKIAQLAGLSERIISLTIVSIGTSLPELATSISAARKRNVDLAIGNIVGSNIFNIFFILGASATITVIPINSMNFVDIGVNLVSGILLFLFIFTGKGRRIEKWEGVVFLMLYVIYMIYLLR